MRLCFLALIAAAAWASASPPVYQDPILVSDGNIPIDVGYYGSPCVADWDGDGLKDLIVGIFDNGNIRLYLNCGTNADPQFDGYTNLEADGTVITLPYG